MNQETAKLKVDLLKQIFPDYSFSQQHNEFVTFCPRCNHHKKKLVLSVVKDVFHCWVCDYGGRIPRLIRTYGSEILWREWQRIIGEIVPDYDLRDFLEDGFGHVPTVQPSWSFPPEARRLKNSIPSVFAQKALSFLAQRGLSYRTIRMYNFYFAEEGKYKDRVIMPSYDEKGKMNFFIARSIYNSSEITKYIHPHTPKENIIFNELFITWECPVVLVEGPFDAITVNRNAIPLLGSSLSSKSLLFQKIIQNQPEVILMLDNDQAGRDATVKVASILSEYYIKMTVAQYSKKDPSELSQKEVFEAIKTRKVLSQTDLMKRILE